MASGTVEIFIDAIQARAELGKLTKEQSQTLKTIKSLEKELKTLTRGTEEYAAKTKEISEARKRFDQLGQSLKNVGDLSKLSINDLRNLRNQINRTGKNSVDLEKELAPLYQRVNKELRERDRIMRGLPPKVDNVTKASGRLTNIFKQVGPALGLGIILGGLGRIASGIARLGRESLKLFDQQAKAVAQVRAGLEATAGGVGRSLEELQAQASELQSNTIFGDEEILRGVTAQLLTFTNITEEQFDRTQKAALDLATRLDGDLQSASIQLGKALNDPVANLSALSRSGIQFSDAQKETIKSLADTNQLAEAQTIILEELERQYGGSAEAAAQAGLGPFQQFRNTLGDIQETIGLLLNQGLTRFAPVLKTVGDFLSEFVDRLAFGRSEGERFSGAIDTAIFVFRALTLVSRSVGTVLRFIFEDIIRPGIDIVRGWVTSLQEARSESPLLSRALGVVQRIFEGIRVTVTNTTAVLEGLRAVVKNVITNAVSQFQIFGKQAEILRLRIQKALTFNDEKDARIQLQIDQSQSQIDQLRQQGESNADVFAKAFNDRIKLEAERRAARREQPAEILSGGSAPVSSPAPSSASTSSTSSSAAGASASSAPSELDQSLESAKAQFDQRSALLRNALLTDEITQAEYQQRSIDLQRDYLQQQQDAYAQFAEDNSTQVIDLQNQLLDLEQQQSDEALQRRLERLQSDYQAEQDLILQQRVDGDLTAVDAQQREEDARLQYLQRKIDILKEFGQLEADTIRELNEELLAINEDLNNKKLEGDQRYADARAQIEDGILAASSELVGLISDLTGESERAQKALVIAQKAIAIAEIGINLQRELSAIAATAASLGPAGLIYGPTQTAIATVRAGIGIAKVASTGFYRGGFTPDRGLYHDGTDEVTGVVHRKEWVGPRWMVEDPQTAPIISYLENIRQNRGAYNDGGLATADTTPAPIGISQGFGLQSADNGLMSVVTELREVVRRFPRRIQATVNYLDIEDAGNDLNDLRSDASL